MINQANSGVDNREESATISSVLGALYDYMKHCFSREEKMMESSDFDGLDAHKKIHLTIAKEFQDMNLKFRKNPDSISPCEAHDFFKNRLLDHITGHYFQGGSDFLKHLVARNKARAMLFMEEEKTPHRAGDWNNFSIMLVDDNKNFLVLVETILKAVGIRRIQLVQDSHSAIEKLIKRPADLVFCDWEMGDINGGELSQKVKELKLASKMVLLTSHSIETMQVLSSNDAVEGYLEKPVSVKSLLDKVYSVSNH